MIAAIRQKWGARRRQVLIAWLAAWPTLTAVLFVLQTFSGGWPLPMRSLASSSAMTLLMNFVSVPMVTAVFNRLQARQQIVDQCLGETNFPGEIDSCETG